MGRSRWDAGRERDKEEVIDEGAEVEDVANEEEEEEEEEVEEEKERTAKVGCSWWCGRGDCGWSCDTCTINNAEGIRVVDYDSIDLELSIACDLCLDFKHLVWEGFLCNPLKLKSAAKIERALYHCKSCRVNDADWLQNSFQWWNATAKWLC